MNITHFVTKLKTPGAIVVMKTEDGTEPNLGFAVPPVRTEVHELDLADLNESNVADYLKEQKPLYVVGSHVQDTGLIRLEKAVVVQSEYLARECMRRGQYSQFLNLKDMSLIKG